MVGTPVFLLDSNGSCKTSGLGFRSNKRRNSGHACAPLHPGLEAPVHHPPSSSSRSWVPSRKEYPDIVFRHFASACTGNFKGKLPTRTGCRENHVLADAPLSSALLQYQSHAVLCRCLLAKLLSHTCEAKPSRNLQPQSYDTLTPKP